MDVFLAGTSARLLGPNLSSPARAATAAHLPLLLVLHDIRDLHVDVEEFGGAAIEAHALALVELALAVLGGDALLLADLVEAVDCALVSML